MLNFDYAVSHFFASLNGQWPAFDQLMWTISSNHLIKGGVAGAFLWFAWFADWGWRTPSNSQLNNNQLVVLRTLGCCVVAELFARLLSATLTFRPRPLFDSSLPFQLPDGITLEALNIAAESSFPSDHAVMFFAFAASISLVSRRAALLSAIWVTVMIAFPRLYLGLHYFSDLAVGGMIGIVVALIGCRVIPQTAILKTIVLRSRTHPAYFYPLFFLVMHQVANMLLDLRNLGSWAKSLFV